MRYHRIYLPIVLILLVLNALQAQQEKLKVEIGENIQLGESLPNEQFMEPHITSHPTDPNHLLAVGWVWSTLKNTDTDVERCASFVSENGGKTWSHTDLPGAFCGDPWVSLTEKEAVLTALDIQTGNQLFAYFSTDGGHSWNETPQRLGYYHDGPRTTLHKDGSVYIASHKSVADMDNNRRTAIYTGRSIKNGQYIETTGQLIPSNLNLAVDGITTLSDGTLVIIYQDFQRHVKGPQRDKNGKWRGVLEKRREWLITSKDKGKTFSFPKMMTEACFDRANGLAADQTNGTYQDRLYSACGGDKGKTILFMYSKGEHKGDYWSDATAIELPESLQGERRDPHIAVNKDGIVAISWLDSRDKPSGCFSPYIAISSDGGESFSKPQRVGSELSCANEKAGKHVYESGRWSWGGDYFGLTAAADGRFHVLWSDARSGKFELMTAAVSVTKE